MASVWCHNAWRPLSGLYCLPDIYWWCDVVLIVCGVLASWGDPWELGYPALENIACCRRVNNQKVIADLRNASFCYTDLQWFLRPVYIGGSNVSVMFYK